MNGIAFKFEIIEQKFNKNYLQKQVIGLVHCE